MYLVGNVVFGDQAETFWTPSAWGFVVLGLCIGLFIGLAEIILKEAWIRVEAGFRSGRELMLSKEVLTIGRGEGCDIALFGDSGVEKLHAHLRSETASTSSKTAARPAAPMSTSAASRKRRRCATATRFAWANVCYALANGGNGRRERCRGERVRDRGGNSRCQPSRFSHHPRPAATVPGPLPRRRSHRCAAGRRSYSIAAGTACRGATRAGF